MDRAEAPQAKTGLVICVIPWGDLQLRGEHKSGLQQQAQPVSWATGTLALPIRHAC